MSKESILSFCRLAWNVSGVNEQGEWHDASAKASLEVWSKAVNRRYGADFCRVELDDGQQSHSVAQSSIVKAMQFKG